MGAAVPLSVGELGPYNTVAWAEVYWHTKWHAKYKTGRQTGSQTDRQDRQRSDSTGQTVLQTVAPKTTRKLQLETLMLRGGYPAQKFSLREMN